MAATAAPAAPAAQKPHAPIPPPHHPTYNIRQVLRDALKEDAGDLGDITTLATIPPETQAVATFLAKASGTLAGLAVVDWVCEEVDPRIKVTWTAKDGDQVSYGLEFGRLEGPAGSILVAERVALNFLQRMSGIATYTSAMVKAAEGYPARILETRKTVPGLRLLDKWAVLIGGGSNHRIGLFDMMMIKDNHIAAAGGMAAAVRRAEEYIGSHNLPDMKVEVETRNPAEVAEVKQLLLSGSAPHVSRVMLDNMTRKDPSQPGGVDVALLRDAVSELRATGVETEASGNVTLETVRTIASTGVTFISCGSLTHSVTALDISLNIKTQ